MYKRRYENESGSELSQILKKEIGRDENVFKQAANNIIDVEKSKCRVVRIFISSTFKDFYWERDVLVKTVFPRLRSWCEEKNIFLLECDLRWGVPKEATGQEAILTCLEEIEKSREEMMGDNFFLGLIGQRYGWSPKMDEVGDLIIKKYSWIDGASVTLMEIVYGALRTMSPNALFMLREPDFISNLDESTRSVYSESDHHVSQKMEQIRRVLSNIFDDKRQVENYSCHCEGQIVDPLSGKSKVKIGGLQDFADKVYDFFKSAIEHRLLNADSNADVPAENSEDDQHKVLLRVLIRNVHGRSDFLTSLISQISTNQFQSEEAPNPDSSKMISFDNGNKIICLYGPAGIGKSTLMACLIRDFMITKNNMHVFYHFCGASVSSKSEEVISSRIIEFLKAGRETTESSQELSDLLKNLNQPTVIIVDALDEISHDGHNLFAWLPFNTPQNVHFIVSCLDKTGVVFNKLDERNVEKIEILPVGYDGSVQIVQSFFMDYGKKLDDKQIENLISHKASNNPLWLIQACEELRIHGDYSSLTKAISLLPDDIDQLNKKILARLINDDTTELIQVVLQILFLARVGIWETDVRMILATVSNHVESEIAHAVWNQVIRSLKPFVNRESNPIPVIKFRHRIIKEVIFEELFKSKEDVVKLHSSLADFYSSAGNSNYKGIEMAYHLYCSYRWHDIAVYLRTKESSQYIKRLTRSQVMRSLRCMQMTNNNQKENQLKICQFCRNTFGYLSCFTPNCKSCLFCGAPHFNFCEARLCPKHEMENFRFKDNCIACRRPCALGKFDPVMICMMCANFKNRCAKLVDENDSLFHSAKNMAIQPDRIIW